MKIYNASDCFSSPLEKLNELTKNTTLMTYNEKSLFLQLMKEHRPKKILEIGSHRGGTTAAILGGMIELDLSAHLYSVELNENSAKITQETVNNVIPKVYPDYANNNFTVLSGGTVANFIKDIGHHIDFCIIDALHVVPGEILDFLTILPFLSENAIIVLHDIRVARQDITRYWVATNLLFSSVVAEERYMLLNDDGHPANIGAFKTNNDTRKYIEGVLNLLSIPWSSITFTEEYFNLIQECYPKKQYDFFIQCANSGKHTGLYKSIDFDLDRLYNLFSSNNTPIFRGAGFNFTNFVYNIHSIYCTLTLLSSTIYANQPSLKNKMEIIRENIIAVDSNPDKISLPAFTKLHNLDYLKAADKNRPVIITVSNEKLISDITTELINLGFSKNNILHLSQFILPERTSLNYLD